MEHEAPDELFQKVLIVTFVFLVTS